MFVLDGVSYNTIEEASTSSGIAKSTLENHINGSWVSKKGVEHTLTELTDYIEENIYNPPEEEIPYTTLPCGIKVAKPEAVLHSKAFRKRLR